MKPKGKYIVLEGMQGSGKTAQINLLATWLRNQGIAVYTTREPGGADAVTRTIRFVLQNPSYNLNTRTEVLLYNAARAQLMPVIQDLLDRGVWVLCDRNYLTTLAVQYYARNDTNAYKEIEQICQFATAGLQPDATFVLDIDAKAAQDRASARYRGERFDQLDLDFLERVRNGYLQEAKKRNLPLIDARKPVADVHDELKQYISQKLITKKASSWQAAPMVGRGQQG